MRLFHKTIGVSVVVIFLLTGQYLEFYYPQMEGVDDGMRMMFRSRHIYILLAGLINICLGTYFSYRRERWRQALQLTGSILIILATALSVGAFFYEPKQAGLPRPLTLPAIVAIFAGTLFHLFGGGGRKRDAGELSR